MTKATLPGTAQINSLKAVRESLGQATSDGVEFGATDRDFVVMPVECDLGDSGALCGMFNGRRARPATLEGSKAAIAERTRAPEPVW
jgi:hypothetical protein